MEYILTFWCLCSFNVTYWKVFKHHLIWHFVIFAKIGYKNRPTSTEFFNSTKTVNNLQKLLRVRSKWNVTPLPLTILQNNGEVHKRMPQYQAHKNKQSLPNKYLVLTKSRHDFISTPHNVMRSFNPHLSIII